MICSQMQVGYQCGSRKMACVLYLFFKNQIRLSLLQLFVWSCYNVLWLLTVCVNWEYVFCCGTVNTQPAEFRKLISIEQCFISVTFFCLFLILSITAKMERGGTRLYKAVELNPKYVKALFRRAKAHEKLDNKKECLEGEGTFVFTCEENY